MKILKKLSLISFILGAGTLLSGIYYLIIKAGIPYPDPTPAMLEWYNYFVKLGETLIAIGLLFIAVAVVFWIVSSKEKLFKRTKNE